MQTRLFLFVFFSLFSVIPLNGGYNIYIFFCVTLALRSWDAVVDNYSCILYTECWGARLHLFQITDEINKQTKKNVCAVVWKNRIVY